MKKDHREQPPKSQNDEQRILVELLNSSEGRIIFAGLIMVFSGITFLTLSWIWAPDMSQILLAMTSTDIVFGWIASMSIGYTMGLRHVEIVPVNMFIETTLVFLFYPLFVFSWKRLIVIQGLKTLMERIGKVAETHHETIRKYGVFGLFIFVWFPFWMTGPVVGCVIGFLLGLKPWLNLAIVLSGTYLAIICWAFLLREVHDFVSAYSPFGSIIFVAFVILILVISNILHGLHREKDSQKE